MSDPKSSVSVPQSDGLLANEKPYQIDSFFKNLLPPLTPEQRAELKDGIRRIGKCDAIKAWRISGGSGQPILWDGHNRDEIVDELRSEGVVVADPVVEISDFDSRSDVTLEIIRNQNARRNWTVEEKAFAIVSNESSKEVADEAKRRQFSGKRVGLREGEAATKGRTDDILGQMAGCGRDFIRKSRIVVRHGDATLIDAVRTQKISLREAHKRVVEQQFTARAEKARAERRPYEYMETDGWENQILCGERGAEIAHGS